MSERLFIAIQIPDAVRKVLAEYQLNCPAWDDVRWVRPENLHITLFFLGDLEERHIPGLIDQLHMIFYTTEAFTLAWHAITYFPPEKYPHMIWATFMGNVSFSQLIERINVATAPFRQERGEKKKEDIPHITLARFSKRRARLQELEQVPLANVHVASCDLIASELTQEGPIYSTRASFHLRKH